MTGTGRSTGKTIAKILAEAGAGVAFASRRMEKLEAPAPIQTDFSAFFQENPERVKSI